MRRAAARGPSFLQSPVGWPRVAARALAAAAAAGTVFVAGAAPATGTGAAPQDPAVTRGQYLALLGDCGACHTAEGGASMAGGLPMATPFGLAYSTNITPDPVTGIGRYTFEQFDRALRQGVAADGRNLYPVMPYPAFARVTEPDMRDLYAYFMRGVLPVRQANTESQLRWPFSVRLGLAPWNLLFARAAPFQADPARSTSWNRGAYIVEGLGHCGACHTPRGLAFQEAGGDAASGQFLAGSTVDFWHAPSLRRLWPAEQIARFLQTGRNDHSAAFGTMAEVVHYSTQNFSDADLAAVAEYLASLSTAPVPSAMIEAVSDGVYASRGGLGYLQFCAPCHRLNGDGAGAIFPPLAGNSAVVSEDPTSAIHVVLAGGHTAQTRRHPRAFDMPAYAALGDAELAEILTFVRGTWGNRASPVTAGQVHDLRSAVLPPGTAQAAFMGPRFAQLLGRPDSGELVYGMRLMVQTRELLPANVGNELECASCHINGGTVAKGAPFSGIAQLFPLYAPRAGRVIDFPDRINACLRRSMNGKPLEKSSREMRAMVAFVAAMPSAGKSGEPIPGRGVGRVADSVVPNAANGRRIFGDQCAVCHGDKGQGMRAPNGELIFPPLAGPGTFNIGAGMARTHTAAGFIRNNMPIGASLDFPHGRGGLSEQEAVDVAEFFTRLPRPDYPDKRKDWPKGGKPADARY